MTTYVRWGGKFYHQTTFMIVNKQLAKNYWNRLNWVVVIVRRSWRIFLNHSIVTMAVSAAVCDICSVKEWCDLENRVSVRSRSLEMAPFDRSHTSSYSPSIVIIWRYLVSFARYSDLFLENREIFIPYLYLAPPQGRVTLSEFCENVWCW